MYKEYNFEPCPWCGEKPTVSIDIVTFEDGRQRTRYSLRCKNCGDTLSTMKSAEILETEWNRAVLGYWHFKNLEYKHKTRCECCSDYEKRKKHCNLGSYNKYV